MVAKKRQGGWFEVKAMPNKIDFVFINTKVEVLRHGMLSDSFGLFYPSDHLQVLVELKIDQIHRN